MFFNTDTADAPWVIIKSDDKKRARLNCMQHFLSSLPYPNKDLNVVHGPDPLIIGSSGQVIGRSEHILEKACTRNYAARKTENTDQPSSIRASQVTFERNIQA